jgi:hypothetical protein
VIPPDHPHHDPDVAHVALRRHSRPPVTLGPAAHGVGVVWHHVDALPADRRAVGITSALGQLAHCRLPRAGDDGLQRPGRADDSEARLARLLADVGPWGR